MIIIPMAGASSRFHNAGYKVPKYMLNLQNKTVFEHSMLSFRKHFETEHFRFVVNGDFDSENFVRKKSEVLNIKSYSVFDVGRVTRGQAETVRLCLSESRSEPITIFNVDTILKYDPWIDPREVDASLDVFRAPGDHWSFVEAGEGNIVVRTTEKERISDLCSNGLYWFKSPKLFMRAYDNMYGGRSDIEHYIAPLFNKIIAEGNVVKYRIINTDQVLNCGTPAEYEYLLKN